MAKLSTLEEIQEIILNRHNDEESRRIRAEYRSLEDKLNASREQFVTQGGITEPVLSAVNRANELVQITDRPEETKADAAVIHRVSDMTYDRVRNTDLNKEEAFDIHPYVNRLSQYFQSHAVGQKVDDVMADLGSLAYKIMKRPPSMDFMVGPIFIQKKVVERRQREKLVVDSSNQVGQMNSSDLQQGSNQATQTMKDIYDGFAMYYLNDPDFQSVNLYEFILNPESFSQSVENLFFVSFLVKDGKIMLDLDEDGLPVLSLPRKDQQGNFTQKATNGQVIIDLEYETWKQLCSLLDLREPNIPSRHYNTDGTFD